MTDHALPQDGQPIVFRNGIVLTMDESHTVLRDADVLVIDGKIAAVGPDLDAPSNAFEIDAAGGIVMPGMIDTHRHMWQTAMRGYGADWTLSQYFVWYYLEHGMKFRPEDIAAGNLISALDAIEGGVTTSVDWSHGLSTPAHGEAAVEVLATSPGRFVFAYGNIHAAPWEWTQDPAVRRVIAEARDDSRIFATQLAFDVPGDDGFPEAAAFATARELEIPVTTHAGVWGATGDKGIDMMYQHGVMQPGYTYVHAATLSDESYQKIAATGGTVSLSTESEQTCGQGYPPASALRKHGIPASLSIDTSVWFSSDMFSAMRSTIGADRSLEHYIAHQTNDTVTHATLRVEDVVDWTTRGGARAIGKLDEVGSLEVGKLADVVLIKNEDSPTMTPILNPYGHVVYQAGRGDVHTVLVGGAPVKFDSKLVDRTRVPAARTQLENTIEFLRGSLGEETWRAGMYPEIPETEILSNPYQYRKH
ncbi:amidohydrolase family protein [Leucobacter allii]|uniref:Amidohydrolase family protein n=1 Tax=Leucobacter allii TaxID=2932247 RepID=A0ABY4FKW4_9MICO|nr:amidohydrolase family protein [Leucobacter allii]UOQ56903.1 amidohydrolase family protein [Leucobacter allii]